MGPTTGSRCSSVDPLMLGRCYPDLAQLHLNFSVIPGEEGQAGAIMIQAKIRAAALVLLVALAVCSPLRAQLLLTYGHANLDPIAKGSYVRWSNFWYNQETGRIGYQYSPQITVGQQWEYDHGVDLKGYDLYRGFAVFNFPRFTGVLPIDGVIIQDPYGNYPEVTQFLARVTTSVLPSSGL